jgi:hypothetical protein
MVRSYLITTGLAEAKKSHIHLQCRYFNRWKNQPFLLIVKTIATTNSTKSSNINLLKCLSDQDLDVLTY